MACNGRNFYYLLLSVIVFIIFLFLLPEVSFLVFSLTLAFFYKGSYILRFFTISFLKIKKSAFVSINKLVSFFSPKAPRWIEDQKNTVFKRAVGESTESIANNLRSPLQKGYECLRLGIEQVNVDTSDLCSSIGGSSGTGRYNVNLLNIGLGDFAENTDRYSFILSAAAKKLGCMVHTREQGLTSGLLRGGGDLIWRVREKDYSRHGNIENALSDKVFLKTLTRSYIKLIEIDIPVADLFNHQSIFNLEKMTYFLEKLKSVAVEKPIGISLKSPDKIHLEAIFENLWLRDIKIDFITIEERCCGTTESGINVLTDIEENFMKSINDAKQTLRYFELDTKIIASGKFVSEFELLRALSFGADSCITQTPFEWLLKGKLNSPLGSSADVKYLIENFHTHTLKAAAKLMGECGFGGVDLVSAERFLKKVGNTSVKNLQNYYQIK